MIKISELLEYIDYIHITNFPESTILEDISIDSRTIRPGEAFVAIRGENFDGHNFVTSAFEKGAVLAFVEQNWFRENSTKEYPIVVVENTQNALGQIANFHRQRFEIPIIAIAGSNGKTTTKDFVAHLLSKKFKVLKTEGNLNNQIGVPLTLLQLNSFHECAVIEIGTNKSGEISYLCDIVEPNYGLITNIGKEHLEFFVDLDGVEQEETSLFGYLLRKDGFVFLNIDDERLAKYSRILGKFISYGTKEDSYVRAEISFDDYLFPKIDYFSEGKKFSARLPIQGISPALCSIPAVAVALFFEIGEEEIISGLESFKLDSSKSYGRMLIKSINGITVINDTYNANPSSMELALRTMDMINTKGLKIGVLGDMKELGDLSLIEHKEIIQKASELLDKVFLCGEEMKFAFDSLENKPKNLIFHNSKETIVSYLINNTHTGDVVLFKASRKIQLDEVVEKYIKSIS